MEVAKRLWLPALAVLVLAAAVVADEPEIPPNIKAYLDAKSKSVKMTRAERKAWAKNRADRLKQLDDVLKRLRAKAKSNREDARQVEKLEKERKELLAERQPVTIVAWPTKKGDVGDFRPRSWQIKRIEDGMVLLSSDGRVHDPRIGWYGSIEYVWLQGVSTENLTTDEMMSDEPLVVEMVGTKTWATKTVRHLRVVDLSKYQRPAKAK